jgi:hypothetical protein
LGKPDNPKLPAQPEEEVGEDVEMAVDEEPEVCSPIIRLVIAYFLIV